MKKHRYNQLKRQCVGFNLSSDFCVLAAEVGAVAVNNNCERELITPGIDCCFTDHAVWDQRLESHSRRVNLLFRQILAGKS